ncbi:MAG: hypothetical protein ACRC62_29580 [Microcoleus sp.]
MAIVTYGMLAESYPSLFDCNATQAERSAWEDLSEIAEDIFCENWGEEKRHKVITYWVLAQKELQDIDAETKNGKLASIDVKDEVKVSFHAPTAVSSKGWMSRLNETHYGRLVLTMYTSRFPLGFYARVGARGSGIGVRGQYA